MAIRTGMQQLISTVRAYTNAAEDEWTLETDGGTQVFWDDQQIQNALDRRKTEYIHEVMTPYASYESGAIVYKHYRTGVMDIESGAAVFKIEDTAGTVTGYTMDYARGVASFTADQAGKLLWWSGYAYDLNAAAADIWSMKASHAAELVDWSTDNHSVKRSQAVRSCLDMAAYYADRSAGDAVQTAKLTRDDL